MNQATLTRLRALKLFGFAAALEEHAAQPTVQSLSFELRLALLVDSESYLGEERKRTPVLQRAELKYAQAAIEDLDARRSGGIERTQLLALALIDWVARGDTFLRPVPV